MFESDLENQAHNIFGAITVEDYNIRFKILLLEIYQAYEQILVDKQSVPRHEDEITKVLVDRYLIKLNNYVFKREKRNNHGFVDIFIVEDFSENKPTFIVECKALDNKNLHGVEGKNAEYIMNGIQRFLKEHYFSYNNLYTNAMIGFIIEKIDIASNIENLNVLSSQCFKNSFEIKRKIELVDNNIYQSVYCTINHKKFIVYHLMMDFSKNIK